MNTQKQKYNKLKDFQRLAYLMKRYAKPYWKALLLFILANLAGTIISAVMPLILAPILDLSLGKSIISTGESQKISLYNLSLSNLGTAVSQWLNLTATQSKFNIVILLSCLYFAAGCLKSLISYCGYLLALWVRIQASRDMQKDLIKHILTLSQSFFNYQRTGELVSRLNYDTEETTAGFEKIISNLIMQPLLILFYGWLLLQTSPQLACAVIVAPILHYGVTKCMQKPMRKRLIDQFSYFAELRARLQELILSIRVVKSFSAEIYELKKLTEALNKVVRINMKYGVLKYIEEPVRSVVNVIIEVGILLLAANELLSGKIAPAAFLLFLYVGRAMIAPVSILGNTHILIQNTLAASERVMELFSEQPKVSDGADRIMTFEDQLKLENVSFAYDKKKVLEGINLSVFKGEIVAFVGPSGAGKSTLADLILRFYDPTEGSITIDGRDLRTLRQSGYRRLFGVVSQEALLFNATVKENISYGRTEISESDIILAAQIANAHEFVVELPQGYDTFVGDRGIHLSGGQRQRIAIARAVVASPQILILDEATSALDSESEKLVQEAIDRVIENTTAIIIAHRLSTVMHADKIIVLDGGRIIDQGRHSELLQRCAIYRRVCELQFFQDIRNTSIAQETAEKSAKHKTV